MKELFNTLSNASEFFKEKRFIFGAEQPEASQLKVDKANRKIEFPELKIESNPRKIEVPEEMAGVIVGRARQEGAKLAKEARLNNELDKLMNKALKETGRKDVIAEVGSNDGENEAEKRAFEGVRLENADTQNGLIGLSLADEQRNIATEADKRDTGNSDATIIAGSSRREK